MTMNDYQILLYYKYTNIEDPQAFRLEHLSLCETLGLFGRIIVASEGINGTVSGTRRATDAYMKLMHDDDRFRDTVFKIDASDSHAFTRLSVRHKREIVHLGLHDDIDPRLETGQRLSASAFHDMLTEDDVVVIDGRNDYEYEIGHFRNAIRPDVKTFREFPSWIEAHKDEFVGKRVLTYCTGGIRCEKLSGYLVRQGLPDVYQLDGGIVTYAKDPDVRGHLFDGKCYVFDERIAVRVNHTAEDVIVSHCIHCGEASDRYINCGFYECHQQHVCCESCDHSHHGFCSEDCERQAICENRIDPRVLHLQNVKQA